nr:MAG: nonstructural protein NS1 [Bee densovirus 6]
MNNGKITDFWPITGGAMGEPSGRSSESPGDLVEDFGGLSNGGIEEGEITPTISNLEQELQSLVDRFVSSIEEKTWKDSGFYISDVYACESVERANRVAKRLEERAESFRRGFVGIFVHGDHVHSIHSCPFTSRTCKCFFKNFPEAKEDLRRLLRRPRAIETFQRRDWENITKYFCTKGRRATFFKMYGAVQRIPLEITALSDALISSQNEGGPQPSLENCVDPLQPDAGPSGFNSGEGSRHRGKRQKRNPINPGGERGINGITGIILELLDKCAVCPLTEIVYTREYLTNSLVASKRLDAREVKDAIDTRASIINTWTRDDFVNFYNREDVIKIWSARNQHSFDNYYMTYEQTTEVIFKLLDFQMKEHINTFANDLVNILECNRPKKNCFLLVSPPSAGKNFMFDGIRDYFLNAGQMNNPNKYNQFAYQDCHNRRIIIWNEPNYEPRETENLKMLFAGDNLSANVKCKPQANVKRTPIIVLSNHRPHFANHSAFADRVMQYNWNSAPFLKEYDKKPRPDAIMNLLYALKDTI